MFPALSARQPPSKALCAFLWAWVCRCLLTGASVRGHSAASVSWRCRHRCTGSLANCLVALRAPLASPEQGGCGEIPGYSGERGFRRCGMLQAVPTRSASFITIVFLVISALGAVLYVREPCVCDRAPRARFVRGDWIGGWAFMASLHREEIVAHHNSIINRAVLVCSVRGGPGSLLGLKIQFLHFRLGDGSRSVGSCCVGGGVFLRAAFARHRSATLPDMFAVCSALASPPPSVLCTLIFGRVPHFAFPRVRQCVGIQQLPGPGGATHRELSLGGTVGVCRVFWAVLEGLFFTIEQKCK